MPVKTKNKTRLKISAVIFLNDRHPGKIKEKQLYMHRKSNIKFSANSHSAITQGPQNMFNLFSIVQKVVILYNKTM